MDYDLNETTETCDHEERSLGAEIGRTVVISAASVAGMYIGSLAIASTVAAIQRRKARKAEKAETETSTEK